MFQSLNHTRLKVVKTLPRKLLYLRLPLKTSGPLAFKVEEVLSNLVFLPIQIEFLQPEISAVDEVAV